MCRAHPRSRGENACCPRGRGRRIGSSPLTRGKPGRRTCAPTRRRLIPAHAGKTVWLGNIDALAGAHPRSRGENLFGGDLLIVCHGSSPLTRGKHLLTLHAERLERLIPAHAGKTPAFQGRTRRPRAHPRSRGENGLPLQGQRVSDGSSPLTRGKPIPPLPGREAQRLIPAHAGKTLPDLRFYCADRSDLGNP